MSAKGGSWQRAPQSYLVGALAIGIMTMFMVAAHADASIANIPMLYMLVVIGSALALGSGPAIFCSVLAFLCFDWFFVVPRYQFTVQDPAEWVSLCTFLFSATITGQLTAMLHKRVEENRRHNLETEALALASWTVASELNLKKCLSRVLKQMNTVVELSGAAIYAPADTDDTPLQLLAELSNSNGNAEGPPAAQDALRFVLARRQPIGWDGSPLWEKALAEKDNATATYLPVIMEGEVLAVLYLKLKDSEISPSTRRVVDSLINHTAVVLQRDRLVRAEANTRALMEADRLKTALLSMVSHDFRSPLTSIKASVGGLLEQGAPFDAETQTGLLQAIDAETDRLNRMVGNILDLSRLEAGAWRPQCEYTSLTELVGSALDSFDDNANERINVQLDSKLPEVWVDSVQMVQVLRNLLENALKYSGGSKIELDARADGNEAIVEVKDRGPGLPKGLEQRIFEPFFRAPEVQESSVPGVGIGLAVCRGLIEAHKGRLTASNRDGGGAIFRVTLPTESAHATS